MRNTRDLMRDWCAATGHHLPLSDLIGRGRAVREAGLLTQGALGINAPAATLRDGAVLLLSIAASRTWKDAPREVMRYGSLPLCKTTGHDPIARTDFDPDEVPYPPGTLLVDVLVDLLEHCGSKRQARFLSLKVDLSEVNPAAVLAFGMYKITPTGETHTKTFFLTFLEPKDWTEELIERQVRLNAVALNAMADLLAPNVAAANRARMQAKHETGPSARTDEPIPLDDPPWAAKPATMPSDNLPRAARPATTSADLEASDKEKKSQVSFKSCGRSSGGSPSPEEDRTHDIDDRHDRPSPCAA
jgi:hypothetical protein